MVEIESLNEARRVAEAGARLGERPRVALRVNPDFQVKGSGSAWARPAAVRHGSEAVPAAWASLPALGSISRASPSSPARRTSCRHIVRGAGEDGGAVPAPGRGGCRSDRYLNLGGRLRHPLFRRDEPLDCAGGWQSGRAAGAAAQARLPADRRPYRAGALHRRRMRRLRQPRGRQEGVRGRTYLVVDGACTISSPPPAISGRSSGATTPSRSAAAWARRPARPCPSSAACARRSTCWRTRWNCRMRRSATSSSVQAGALWADGEPDAFSATPLPARSWFERQALRRRMRYSPTPLGQV